MMEAVGAHRRTVEGLLHIDVLVENPELAWDYWRSGSQFKRQDRQKNKFKRHVDKVQREIANTQIPEQRLTALQRMLRQRSDDALMHMGHHPGIQHIVATMPASDEYSLFDVQMRSGLHVWRFASETLQLAGMLVPKLKNVAQSTWAAGVASLRKEASELERIVAEQSGRPTPAKSAWAF
jgi:phosphohistidine phosphatase SixA